MRHQHPEKLFPVYWFQCMFLRTIFLDQNWHVCIILYNHIIFIYIYILVIRLVFIMYLFIYLFDMIYNLLQAFDVNYVIVWCIEKTCLPKFYNQTNQQHETIKCQNATQIWPSQLPTNRTSVIIIFRGRNTIRTITTTRTITTNM